MDSLLAVTIVIVVSLVAGFFWHDTRIMDIEKRLDVLNRYVDILVKDNDDLNSRVRNLEAKVSDQKEIISKLRDGINKLAFHTDFPKSKLL